MRRLIVIAVASLGLTACDPDPIPTPVRDGECGDLVAGGFPAIPPWEENPVTYFLCQPQNYAAEFSPYTKTPNWVVYRAKGEEVSKEKSGFNREEPRRDPFIGQVPGPSIRDYQGYGYRLLFMADPDLVQGDPRKYSTRHYLSLTVPQHPGQAAIWDRLERSVAEWAKTYDDLYVITGPIYGSEGGLVWIGPGQFENQYPDNPTGRVHVPLAMYKVIINPKEVQAIAFVIPNQPIDPATLNQMVVRLETIESRIKIQLLPRLQPDQRSSIMQSFKPELWPLAEVKEAPPGIIPPAPPAAPENTTPATR